MYTLGLEHCGATRSVAAATMGIEASPWDRKPWVACITGMDSRYGLARTFLRARTDYSDSNRTGDRGIRLWFLLESDRLYEVKEHRGRYRWRRFFVLNGKEITREEAMSWLASS